MVWAGGGMTSYQKIMDASSLLASDDGEAVCYLCLGTGADEAGQPLRRDCACRGTDAGFVHLSCLTNYAATKSKGWDGRDTNEFVNPWDTCPSCYQEYQNELGIDIASEFVSFVRRQYPHNTQSQVEALHVKKCALMKMVRGLQPVKKREAGVTTNVLLSLIDRMKTEEITLSLRYSQFEAEAHNTLGHIALDERTKESARRAEAYFEKYLELSESMINESFGDEFITCAKKNIALAKSRYECGGNDEELLMSQELYELRVSKYGEENEYTIGAGQSYAVNLQKANRRGEARDLLIKLLSTSKQVFGPDHNTTKGIGLALAELMDDLDNEDEDEKMMRPRMRFKVGDRVLCRVDPDPVTGWAPGKVVKLWYREPLWPPNSWAPYKIELDDNSNIFAPRDNDEIIRELI
jgi:hypothetical protein